MISLEEFMATEKPKRRSKLEPFKKDILTLKNEGYSEASIIKYLAMNGVTVSQRAVNKFVHRNKDAQIETITKVETSKKKLEEKKTKTSTTTPRKFDWQSPVDKSDII